jgi:hypothetical protein
MIASGDQPSEASSTFGGTAPSHDDSMTAWVISECVPGWKPLPRSLDLVQVASRDDASDSRQTRKSGTLACDLLNDGKYEEAYLAAAADLRTISEEGEAGRDGSALRQKLLTGTAALVAGHYQVAQEHLSEVAATLDEDVEPGRSASFRFCALAMLGESCRASLMYAEGVKVFDRALAILETRPDIPAERCAFVSIE